MAEIVVKVDVPIELKGRFEVALAKVVKQFIRRLRFFMLDEIMSRSELTDEQITELSHNLKKRVAEKHGL